MIEPDSYMSLLLIRKFSRVLESSSPTLLDFYIESANKERKESRAGERQDFAAAHLFSTRSPQQVKNASNIALILLPISTSYHNASERVY